jgi:hypothetical protein
MKYNRKKVGAFKTDSLFHQVKYLLAFTSFSEHKLRAENLPFDIDVWYPMLKDHTFPSVFLPLTRSEGKAIIYFYQTRNQLKRERDLHENDVCILYSVINIFWRF